MAGGLTYGPGQVPGYTYSPGETRGIGVKPPASRTSEGGFPNSRFYVIHFDGIMQVAVIFSVLLATVRFVTNAPLTPPLSPSAVGRDGVVGYGR